MQRSYVYYNFTLSLCSVCLKQIAAKVVFQDECVYLLKNCDIHGPEKVLISTDIDYYKKCCNYMKPSGIPRKFNTPVRFGCPYDCGLCTDHEQHSCLTIIEVTDRCNLTCPICYSVSSPSAGSHRSLELIEQMIDCVVENEGEPDVVQISGGEPTLHPQFFEILDIAKSRPIRHLMLNTNGIRIATEAGFAEKLAEYAPRFEIYLQFDSLQSNVLNSIRGADLKAIRLQALEKLNALNLSTTLVVVLQKGQNDQEIGELIQFALKQRCVRGITFQPIQSAGRVENFNPETDRMTLSEVRKNILAQSPLFLPEDLLPVPCNPDSLVMGYALKIENEVFPLTRYLDPNELLDTSKNSIVYEGDVAIKEHLLKIFSTGESPQSTKDALNSLLCCLPQISAPELRYENIFRIIIMRFMDAYDFDVRAVKKSCVHIVHPDGRIIPFETMNLFYRNPSVRSLETVSTATAN